MLTATTNIACDKCGRSGWHHTDRVGTTCGYRLTKMFRPLTDQETMEALAAGMSGVPLPASHPASVVSEVCLGTLVPKE